MPTPIFQPYSPGIGDDLNKRIKGLTNAYIDTTQQLQWLLTHLDEKNVLKAQSVVADWVYAGNIKTNQLIAGETLIDNALIKNLSASKIAAGTITASISIQGPTIVGGLITGGVIIGGEVRGGKLRGSDSTDGFIIVGDRSYGDLNLYRGSGGYPIFRIYDNGGNNAVGLMAGNAVTEASTFLASTGTESYAFGSWNFGSANVTGITAKFG